MMQFVLMITVTKIIILVKTQKDWKRELRIIMAEMQTPICSQTLVDSGHREVSTSDFKTINGALSSLRQFLAFESPLRMMKNAFYFTLKAPFVLKTFKFLSCLSNFKICDDTTWLRNNCDTHID